MEAIKTMKPVNFKREVRKARIKKKFKDGFNKTRIWFCNNRELVLVMGPAVIGFGATALKVAGRRSKLRKEKQLKDLYCYDRSLGHYWRLKRELSNREWVEIDKRKANGERLADILDELRLLK